MRCTIIGAGLTGAAAACKLAEAGWDVHVIESEDEPGGNCRTGTLAGIRYERFGPHIFHTDDEEVAWFVSPYITPYEHRVETLTSAGKLHWPPQLSQLKTLADWPKIEKELADRPALLPVPAAVSFEEYGIALMGQTLYRIFLHGYSLKQWGRDPAEMSAVFAPKRIDFRDDDYLPLFRDKFQGWLDAPLLIRNLLRNCMVTLGQQVKASDFAPHDSMIVTAALDQFLHDQPLLEWRGNRIVHEYKPGIAQWQDAGCVNLATMSVAPVRVTEAKIMTGDNSPGTVLSYEYPQGDIRSHPVNDVKGRNRMIQQTLQDTLMNDYPFAVPAGRLGRYVYIDMDQAIRQGWNAASRIMKLHEISPG